jgi:hypothetical protein
MNEGREVDEHEEVTYAPSEIFIQARSQVDQDWMQAVMTRVLLRAR